MGIMGDEGDTVSETDACCACGKTVTITIGPRGQRLAEQHDAPDSGNRCEGSGGQW